MVSEGLLWAVIFAILFLIGAHVTGCRLGRVRSSQALLIKLVLILNVPLLGYVAAIAVRENRMAELLWMGAFALITFNGLGYVYFHFFNLSDTARRFRLLRMIAMKPVTAEELLAHYSPGDMIHARLERLEASGQIAQGKDARFRLRSRFLLYPAYFIRLCRKVYGF